MGVAASAAQGGGAAPTSDDQGPWGLSLDIQFDRLSGVRPLAQGTGCSCNLGKLGSKQVAIKTLKPDSSKVDAEDLDNELNVLQLLHHPYIVRLAGAGQTPQGKMFVATEFLSRGTLSSAIGTDAPEGTTWMWRARVRMWFPLEEALRQAAGVASALAYMHDEAMPGAKILHRDIKGNNLAFAADGTLKIFDLGLAKILRPRDLLGDNIYKMTGNTGSLRYMAPEVARSLPSNDTADVYSFAMVMWEMASIVLPFNFLTIKGLFDEVVLGGARPRLAPGWPEEFKETLTKCWSADLKQRPSMAELERRLRKLLKVPEAS